MKKGLLLLVSILLLGSCGVRKKENHTGNEDAIETSNVQESVTEINETENSANNEMLHAEIGGVIPLETMKVYQFGRDIKPGTYQLEVAADEGMQAAVTFTASPSCTWGMTSQSSGNAAFEKEFPPMIFEEGFKLELKGEYRKIDLRYVSDVQSGFDFNSAYCDL